MGTSITAFACRGFAVCAIVASLLSPSRAQDPIPIQRVLTTPERLLQEMKRTGQGRMTQMTRVEFEALVRRADEAAEAQKKLPRLVEATYRARFVEAAEPYLSGSAHWKIHHPGTGPGVLPLPQFNLAVRQPRFENRDALLAEFDGKTLGLLLDEAGEHAVTFDWSARTAPQPGTVHLDLEVPAAPVATFELDLPSACTLALVSEECVLSGPHPAANEDRRLWIVRAGGVGQVRLGVRREGTTAPLLLATLQAQQELAPDSARCEFAFDVRVLHQPVRRLTCLYDPALQPFEVVVPNLEKWELQPPRSGGPAALTIDLREPLETGASRSRGVSLVVRALAPLAPRAGNVAGRVDWSSPGMWLAGAVPRGETLNVRLSREVRLETCDPGPFRLARARSETDGSYLVTLEGAGDVAPEKALPRRPLLQLVTRGAEFRVRELLWWQTTPGKSVLTAQLTYEVLRGRLPQLQVALPRGWEVDRVEMTPADLLRNWGVRSAEGERQATLLVDLKSALGPRTVGASTEARRSPRLLIWLRPSQPTTGREQEFPDLVPLGATLRDGGLAVEVEERAFEPILVTAAVASEPPEDGPWGRQVPDYFFPARGQPVAGTLRMRTQRPRVLVRCVSEVLCSSPAGPALTAVVSQLTLQPAVGQPTSIDVYLSAARRGEWTWKARAGTNTVRGFERLAGVDAAPLLAPLAARQPLGAAGLLGAALAERPRGERWRLTFTQPLIEPLELEGVCQLAPAPPEPAGETGVEVPLPVVLDAGRMEGEVRLHVAGASPVQVETVGLREGPASRGAAGSRPAGAIPWRTFRYGATLADVGGRLIVRGLSPLAAPAAGTAVEQAELTAAADVGGRVRCRYRFAVRGWRLQTFPVRLPARCQLLTALVDGRAILHATPSQVDPAAPGLAGVELPVPAGDEIHTFEVRYAVEQPAWALWTCLHAPALHLAVEPTALRRTWQLPAGVWPLRDAAYRRLPGAPGQDADDAPSVLGFTWARHLALPSSRLPLYPDNWAADQRQRLEAAAAANPGATLGEALDRLSFDRLEEIGPLVVDAVAFAEAGLGPWTPLPPATGAASTPFWERLGIVHLPCRVASLLTTRPVAGSRSDTLSAVNEQAVAEAATHGNDASGRYRNVTSWLQGAEATRASEPPALSTAAPSSVPGTEWEAIASRSSAASDESMLVVRPAPLAPAGLVLAAVLALAFWKLRAHRLVYLLAWLAASGLGVIWLPASLRGLAVWPFAVCVVVAGCAYLFGSWPVSKDRTQTGPARTVRSQRPLPTALALFLALSLSSMPLFLPAAVPESFQVFLVTGSPNEDTVLAPPELLDQLNALVRRGQRRGAVLTAASCEGRARPGADSAELEATFHVQHFGRESAPLLLPLGGVQLEEMLLDGARVHPVAAEGMGYQVRVEGEGKHVLQVRFRVAIQSAGALRTVQFQTPALVQNRLSLALPPGASHAQAVVKQGGHRVEGDAQAGLTLLADLGRVTAPVQVRWLQADPADRAPAVTISELYLWQLGPAASGLTAVLQYGVTQGAVTTLAVDLPEALEVAHVEASASGDGGPGAPGSRARLLRDWQVTSADGKRQLRLEFLAPITSSVQLMLDLVPRRPLANGAPLPLPVPRGAQTTQGYVGYRVAGLTADVASFQGLRPIPANEFTKLWLQAAGPRPAAEAALPADFAGFFDRKTGTPLLNLHLGRLAPRLEVVQDVSWLVGLAHADLKAVLKTTTVAGDLSLIEWEVPVGITVTQVSGADVDHWARRGPRLLIWLQRPVSTTEVQVSGWMTGSPSPPAPLPRSGGEGSKSTPPAPRPRSGGEGGKTATPGAVWELPTMHVPAAESLTTLVRLTAARDLALTRLRSQRLSSWPDLQAAPPAATELAYVTRSPDHSGTFRIQPAASALAREGGPLEVQSLTFVEVRDRQLTFTAVLHCRAGQGSLRRLTVRLRHWSGAEVAVDCPGARIEDRGKRRPAMPDGRLTPLDVAVAERSWTLDVSGSSTTVALTGSVPIDDAAVGVGMPEIVIDEAGRTQVWLAAAGGDLAAEEPRGLIALTGDAATDAVRPWPREADRVRRTSGTVWRVVQPGWSLRIVPLYRPQPGAAARVHLVEQRAALAPGVAGRWVHQADVWLVHDPGIDLAVALPQGAQPLGVAVDGESLRPVQRDGLLWVPLPPGGGVRRVNIGWACTDEAFDRPNLAPLRIEGAAGVPMTWTVHLPPGHELTTRSPRQVTAAHANLRRAEGFLRLSTSLSGSSTAGMATRTADLADLQRRFADACRAVEYELVVAEWVARFAHLAFVVPPNRDPGAPPLADQLQRIKEENLQWARAQGFDALRAAAEAARGSVPRQGLAAGTGNDARVAGLPLYWITDDALSPAVPALELVPVEAGEQRRAWARTVGLLLLLLAGGLLACFPEWRQRMRALWPEQVMLVGVLAWLTLGAPLAGVAIVLVGLIVRLLLMAQRGLAWLRRAPATS